MRLSRTLPITIAMAAIGCLSNSSQLLATAPNITYSATGTFAADPPANGNDTLKLGGEPFSVKIVVSAATVPAKRGSGFAVYEQLVLTGYVKSGLTGQSQWVPIKSKAATIIQQIFPGKDDVFTMEAPINVSGIRLVIKAVVTMPLGTISTALLHPFSGAVAMSPTNASFTYSNSSASTTLNIQKGTLNAVATAAGAAKAALELYSGAGDAITVHPDGSSTVRAIGAGPINVNLSTDSVLLKLYATGVSDANEVHVQIGGQEVPLIAAGASGEFAGADEILVRVPQSLAGRGPTTVTITADGQTTNSIPIHIQ